MISAQELNPHAYSVTSEQQANLAVLLERLNVLRAAFGKPWTVTSGLRSQADQARINPGSSHSRHLLGAAADIYDPDAEIHTWCKANEALLEATQVWLEERQGDWQHFQIFPPASGHRWFYP